MAGDSCLRAFYIDVVFAWDVVVGCGGEPALGLEGVRFGPALLVVVDACYVDDGSASVRKCFGIFAKELLRPRSDAADW